MRARMISLALCLAVIAASSPAMAQDAATPHLGSRLRVTAPSQLGHRIVGSMSAVDSVLLTIERSSGERIGVRRDAIRKLEVSTRRGRRGRGALIGTVVSLGLAGLAAAGTKPDDFLSPGDTFLVCSIVFVPIGAGLGAIVAHGERWVTVPDRALGAAEPAQERRLGLAVHF